MPTRIEEIQENLRQLQEEIVNEATTAGRKAEEVQLIAVSKTYPFTDVEIANGLGCQDFGENRVQELMPKIEETEVIHLAHPLRWHLIGTLQRNKVKYIVGKVHLIHSIDSIRLLNEVEKQCANRELTQDILLQVNIAEEESKHGFSEEEILSAAEHALGLEHLRLRGLMTMAPIGDSPDEARPVFSACRKWQEKVRQEFQLTHFDILSMGMSQDFPAAIAEGATHIRVGSRIFGQRDYA